MFRVLEKISVSATCVIVSKKDANFSASERGIYTRDVIRSERYTNDRERRKRGRSGRHRGGTVHSFYFYCFSVSGSIARVLTLLFVVSQITRTNIIVCPRVVVFFAFIIKFERLTRVNTSL